LTRDGRNPCVLVVVLVLVLAFAVRCEDKDDDEHADEEKGMFFWSDTHYWIDGSHDHSRSTQQERSASARDHRGSAHWLGRAARRTLVRASCFRRSLQEQSEEPIVSDGAAPGVTGQNPGPRRRGPCREPPQLQCQPLFARASQPVRS